MQNDVDKVVGKYVAMRSKSITISSAIATVLGVCVGYAVWAWTSITLSLLSGEAAHIAASWFYGWLMFAGCLFVLEGLAFDAYVVPDEALAELARLEIRNKQALAALQAALKQNGFVRLTDMERFARLEEQSRILEQTLDLPGNHPLLNPPSPKDAASNS